MLLELKNDHKIIVRIFACIKTVLLVPYHLIQSHFSNTMFWQCNTKLKHVRVFCKMIFGKKFGFILETSLSYTTLGSQL
jgi:hypothetical protein